jgi:hypothetical protein
MRIPIPRAYDYAMDFIALVLFPSCKYATAFLLVYTTLLAIGLVWYLDNWLWAPAVVGSMALAYIMTEWLRL